jgi:PAS domain S-box-containing protein
MANFHHTPSNTPPVQGLLSAIVDSSEDAIVSMTLDGTITSWNDSAERVFGYSKDEAVGENVSFLVPPEMEEQQRDIIVRVQAGERVKHYETVRIGKNERYVDTNLTVSPVRDAKEEIIGASMIMQDITDRKIMEANLKTYLGELENSNKKLEEFSHITSHDLKEPLRGLSILSSFLLEDYKDKLGEKGTEQLKRLAFLCQKMDLLINNLLYFSKLENEKTSVQKTDLNEIIEDIQQMMELSLKEKNARIVIPHPLPIISCDKIRIVEVFRNLITNAVKYNDKEKPVVEVGFLGSVETQHGREENVFYVKDNGIGIEPKYHQLIFTMFKKAPSSGEDKKNGSGVGLAFAKKIIENHNGHIWLESEPGKGSTFYFTLNQKDALHG